MPPVTCVEMTTAGWLLAQVMSALRIRTNGVGLTVTLRLAVAVHPFTSVTTTRYVPELADVLLGIVSGLAVPKLPFGPLQA